MAKWYEGAEEACFKPTAGGYVYRSANPWLLGRSRYYLVNEAQKAALAACLRQRLRLALPLAMVYLLIALGFVAFAKSSGAPHDPSSLGFAALLGAAFLLVLLVGLGPHIFLLRKVRPLLANLPRTEERLSFHDQVRSFAAAVSGTLLLLGGGGGALMIAGNIVVVADGISEGRAVSQLYWAMSAMAAGALLTGYFVYLAILKRKLKREAN